MRSDKAQVLINDKLNVGLLGVSDVRNISSEFGANYEERSSIDIYLSHDTSVVVGSELIAYANITLNSENEIKQITVNNPKNKE